MGTKKSPGMFDCYANALPDEPMFVLLARDPDAPDLIETWAQIREIAIQGGHRPFNDKLLVAEARECARNMREWRKFNDGKWRV